MARIHKLIWTHAGGVPRITFMCGVGFLADVSGRQRRQVLPLALTALARMAHRGAVDADGRTGDGAGVMTGIPRALFGVDADTAIGIVFLNGGPRRLASALAAHALPIDDLQPVQIDESVLGDKARRCRPDIRYVVIRRPPRVAVDEFECRLARARKESHDDFSIASLSHRTMVWKALVRAGDLAAFYPDLRRPEFETSFALFHQRFSTNTLPSWSMTQPFGLLAHNGEINTIAGNRAWMRARGHELATGVSDSCSLDEAASILDGDLPARIGTLLHGGDESEPWEGPALVVFADGDVVGAALDRNGLRPARLATTIDGLVLVASEAGVLDVDEQRIIRRGRLGPGEIVTVHLKTGEFRETRAADTPRGVPPSRRPSEAGGTPALPLLRTFGYTRDEIDLVLKPMYENAAEPVGSMGDDTPLAFLSARKPLLFSYFKQRFAQVTNPPIDPYRESIVMSLGRPLLQSAEGHRLSLLFESSFDVERLLLEAGEAVRSGAASLVLSDKGVDATHAAIPSLLAVSAVHHHLVREGLRLKTKIIIETADARDDHQIATLLGFGADAVHPWLALDLAPDDESRARYLEAIEKGLLKIMSKMGVSTMRSYRGAQLFEAIGIDGDLIERHFTGTPTHAGGIGLAEIERDVLARHAEAFASTAGELEDAGRFRYRQNGETHAFAPPVVKAIHSGDYRAYAQIVNTRDPMTLRDLFDFAPAEAVPIDEVEPASAIVRRFMTSAMSLGAISPEAQAVLAEAMNRLGARSNCGEGGDPHLTHRVKQVASARFGVTAEYLVAADELQIKIAQGSKPGEGGQLPGHKVTAEIAAVRHATPGQTLISPPPHHDIYSIEDLAQLIYDLKRINPLATVSVKLVSSAGIGTIAVGVAKAYADAIEVSGHDGGTGASPLGSIKNAGTPWELGLMDVQKALAATGLRGRVRLQVNGGLKTGRDVVIAAILGADEFGFGTAALVAAGCVMARQCHLNTCPVGIATQREDLRAKFKGTPENVMRFFTAIAAEVREILAKLGVRSIAEIIGRSEILAPHAILSHEDGEGCGWSGERNHPPHTGHRLDEKILRGHVLHDITNADRAVGARIAGTLVRRPATIEARFRGSAGQSFGAFCVGGMRLVLDGEANDYVGKSMSGGEIVIRPYAPSIEPQVIAGNTLLYGATGGRAFIAGAAGERFAVRNSGALAIVEGAGDHACEYMTAGLVLILGASGRNLGAGMSGGIVFAVDPRVNPDSVIASADLTEFEDEWLQRAIDLHLEKTGSRLAEMMLREWSTARTHFRRVLPVTASAVPHLLPEIARSSARYGTRRAADAH